MKSFVTSALVFLERELNVYAYSVISALALDATHTVSWTAAKSALYAGVPAAVSLAHTLLTQLAASVGTPAAPPVVVAPGDVPVAPEAVNP